MSDVPSQSEITAILESAIDRQREAQARAAAIRGADRVPDAGTEPAEP